MWGWSRVSLAQLLHHVVSIFFSSLALEAVTGLARCTHVKKGSLEVWGASQRTLRKDLRSKEENQPSSRASGSGVTAIVPATSVPTSLTLPYIPSAVSTSPACLSRCSFLPSSSSLRFNSGFRGGLLCLWCCTVHSYARHSRNPSHIYLSICKNYWNFFLLKYLLPNVLWSLWGMWFVVLAC